MENQSIWAVISLLFGAWNAWSAYSSFASGDLTWTLIDGLLAVLMVAYAVRTWRLLHRR